MINSIIAILFIVYILISLKKEQNEQNVKEMIAYRGLFAIVIVLDHLSQELNSPGLMKMFSYCGYITVSCFFALSGFGLTEQYKKNGKEYFCTFFTKRFPKILIPFWLSNLVYILVNIFIYNKNFQILEFIKHLIGIELINTNSWYVISLVVLYIIYYISVKLLSKGDLKKSLKYIFLGISIYGIFVFLILKKDWWMNACYAFIIGIIVSIYKNKEECYINTKIKNKLSLIKAKIEDFNKNMWLLNKEDSILKYIITTLIFTICFIASWKLKHFTLPFTIVASISIAMIMFYLTKNFTIKSRILGFVGKISYELYLSHNLFRHLFKDIYIVENDQLYLLVVITFSLITAFVLNKINTLFFRMFKTRKENTND